MWKLAIRLIGGATLGALPGAVVSAVHEPRIGIAIALLGGLVGALLSIPGASVDRTLQLFWGVTAPKGVVRRMGGIEALGDGDWKGDRSSRRRGEVSANERFTEWILARDVKSRRGWVVVAGLIVGLAAGVAIAVRDLRALSSGEPGWVLPFTSKDTLAEQAVMFSLAISIWGGAAFGLISGPAFRRPLIVGMPFGCFIVGIIGLSASIQRGPGPLEFGLMGGTVAAVVAMFIAAFATRETSPQPAARPSPMRRRGDRRPEPPPVQVVPDRVVPDTVPPQIRYGATLIADGTEYYPDWRAAMIREFDDSVEADLKEVYATCKSLAQHPRDEWGRLLEDS